MGEATVLTAVLISLLLLALILAADGWRRALLAKKALRKSDDPRLAELDLLDRLRILVEQRTQMLDSLPLPMCYVDRDGRYQFANRAYCLHKGRPLRELLQATVNDVHSEAELEAMRPRLLAVFRGEDVLAATPGGADHADEQTLVRYLPHVEAGGQVSGYIETRELPTTALDAPWLQRTQATMQAVVNAIGDGLILLDEGNRIEGLNGIAEQMLGYGEHELFGQPISLVLPNLTAAGVGGPGDARHLVGRRRDGSEIALSLACGEGGLGTQRVVALVLRQAEETAAACAGTLEGDALPRLVAGLRHFGLLLLDASGHIRTWNDGAAEITGWSAEEVLGQHVSRLYAFESIVRGDPERALQTAREAGRHEELGWRLRKDGSGFWCFAGISALPDAGGAIRAFGVALQDMSGQVELEKLAEEAATVAERAKSDGSKLASAASHDMRQPTEALLVLTDLLHSRLNGHPAHELLGVLGRSAGAMQTLLDTLLDVARLDDGLVAPQPKKVAVADLLQTLSASFAGHAVSHGIDLRIVGSRATVATDPGLAGRILHNAVEHAIRHASGARILVGCRRRGRSVRLQVWNTAGGHPQADAAAVFGARRRLDGADAEPPGGLGLSVAERFARLLGHEVGISVRPGGGSVFTLDLPVTDAADRSAHGRRRVPSPLLACRRIVVIDDEAIVLIGLRLLLEDWGYEVVAAASEEEAMQQLAACGEPPDMILADYRLRHGKTGPGAIRHIREYYNAPIPSIIITGDTAPERLRDAEASGCRILHKPVHPPTLEAVLNNTLRAAS